MFRRLILPLLAGILPLSVAVVACSVTASAVDDDVAANGDAGEANLGQNPSTVSNPTALGDAGATLGNPICGATAANNSCWPDDDGVQALPTGASACAPIVPDGGTTADASTAVSACRVGNDAGAPTVDCDVGGADTRGVDGVSCQTGDDCAPGFDCVDGDNGAVCRRYCCSGSCDGYPAANNGPTFCDVRAVDRAGVTSGARPIAPVCMPIKTCKLLEAGDCASTETCAIVNDKGTTGCVPLEPNTQAGASCEQTHCAADQTCLGSPGNRKCYQLCRTTGGAGCTAPQACVTSSAFQDTSYGVCTTQH